MPEIKHHFRVGRMNKDLDERLVPNGEYRDAQNIEIITSEGSDIGSIQNSLGNTLINGKKLNVGTSTVSNWSADFISNLTNAECIGYVVDNENNKIYWVIASDQASCIAEYDDVTKEVLPVLVDTGSILNFSKDYLVTGINVIEGLLAWTDNQTDPKKINIEKFKSGSVDFATTTKYDGTVMNATQRAAASNFKNENITTIKIAPRNAPTLTLNSSKRPGVGTSSANKTFSSYNFYDVTIGDEFTINFSPTPIFLKNDIINLTTTQENVDKTINTYTVSIKIIELLNNGNSVRATITKKPDSLITGNLQYECLLEQGKPLFEKKLVRFAYRWKYNDGEYSTFSPFSDIAFLPGTFSYKSDDGYNNGMLNTVRSIIVSGFTKPIDVDRIEVLIKESNNNLVYLTHVITDSSTSYTVESETLGLVIPSNQLLRPWDNVPLKAKAQETIGNRLVYANYVQGYNIEDINIPEISTTIKTGSVSSSSVGEKSLKSERTYQLGVVYSDYFQRETPVFSSKKSSISLEKSYAELKTNILAKINTTPPDWATHYKYFIKETSNEYYNLALDRFYLAEDNGVWLSFPSSERNKLAEERYMTLKKKHDSDEFVKEEASYRILDIKNEAPDSLTKEVRLTSSYRARILSTNADKPSVNSSYFKFRGPTDVENPEFARSFNSIGYLSITSYDPSTAKEIGTTNKYKILSGGINGVSDGSGITTVYEVDLEEGFESKESTILGSSVFSANSEFKIEIYQEISSYKPEFSGRFFVKINRDDVLNENVIDSFKLSKSKFTSKESKIITLDSNSDFTVENKDVSGFSWTDTKAEENGDYDDLRLLDNEHPTAENKQFSIIVTGINTEVSSIDHHLENKLSNFLSKIEQPNTFIQFSNEGGFSGNIYKITSASVSADYRSSDISKQKKISGKRRRYTIKFESVLDGGGYSDEFIVGGSNSTGIITQISIVQKQIDYENENLTSENPAIFETKPSTSVDLDLFYEATDQLFILRPGMKIQNTQYSTKKVITGIDNSISTNGIKSTVISWSGTIQSTINTGYTYRIWSSDELYYKDVTTTGTNSATSIALSQSNKIHGFENEIDWFNCFSFGNGVESNRIQDDFNAIYIDKGPVVSSTIDTRYKSDHKKSGLIFSGIINSISGVNDLNQFIQAEAITKELNPEYGSIQRLVARDTDLVTFCEDKVVRILANKDALYNADGNPQLTASNNVLGQTIPYLGEYGCSKFPEAICSYGYRMYFLDRARSCVLRLSRDGVTNISEKGMGDWFNDNIPLSNSFLGTFDENKKCYNITLNNYTISFDERVDGWTSFRSFIPEFGTSLNGLYYTFNQGLLYSHNNAVRNNFYGNSYQSSVNVLMNEVPSSIKHFKTLNYEGSDSRKYTYSGASQTLAKTGWYANSLKTEKQTGVVKEFVEKEGLWSNSISGDTTSIDNLDEKEFSVQGIGSYASIAGETARTQVNITKTLTATGANISGKVTISDPVKFAQNINSTVSNTSVFTITPLAGYSLTHTNFSGTGCTFTQSGNNVSCSLASSDNAVTSDIAATINITHSGTIATTTYSLNLSYETFEENTSTLSRINTTTYSNGVADVESQLFTLTFTPDSGFEFDEAPEAAVVYSNGGSGKNMYRITNNWSASDKDAVVTFTVRYSFGSKNTTGDKIVFVAKAIKEVTTPAAAITSVSFSKVNILKSGETRTFKIIGTPGASFNIKRNKHFRGSLTTSVNQGFSYSWWGFDTGWRIYNTVTNDFVYPANFTIPSNGVYEIQEVYPASGGYVDWRYRVEPGVDYSNDGDAANNLPATSITYTSYNSSGVVVGNEFPGSNHVLSDNVRNTNASASNQTTLSFASLPTFDSYHSGGTTVLNQIISWAGMPAGKLYYVSSINGTTINIKEFYRKNSVDITSGTFGVAVRDVSITVANNTPITFSSRHGEFLVKQIPDGFVKLKLKRSTLSTGVASLPIGGTDVSTTAAVNGSISGTTALVVDTNSGDIAVNDLVTGTGVDANTLVSSLSNQQNLVLSDAETLSNNVALNFGVKNSTYDITSSYAFHEPSSSSSKYLIHVEKEIQATSVSGNNAKTFILSESRNPKPEDFKYQKTSLNCTSAVSSGQVIVFTDVPDAIFVGSKVEYNVSGNTYQDTVAAINTAKTQVTINSRSVTIPTSTTFLFNKTLAGNLSDWSFNIQNVNGVLNNSNGGNKYTLSFDLEVSKYSAGNVTTEIDLDNLLYYAPAGTPSAIVLPSIAKRKLTPTTGISDIIEVKFLTGGSVVIPASNQSVTLSGTGYIIAELQGNTFISGGGTTNNNNTTNGNEVTVDVTNTIPYTISNLSIDTNDLGTWGSGTSFSGIAGLRASKFKFHWQATYSAGDLTATSSNVSPVFNVVKHGSFA